MRNFEVQIVAAQIRIPIAIGMRQRVFTWDKK
jgi:hypothetical protein